MTENDETKSKKTKKKAETKSENNSFFSGISSKIVPLENKAITGLIDNFILDLTGSFTVFLGKKANIVFDSVQFYSAEDSSLEKKAAILSSFQIATLTQNGLVHFDFPFMHSAIDILYGASGPANGQLMSQLGKAGGHIAEKFTQYVLASFQSALQEYKQTTLTHLLTSDHASIILNKYLPDYYFELLFKVDLNGASGQFSVIVPEALFEEIAQDKTLEQPAELQRKRRPANEKLKKDIIDSTITLIACLEGTTLKIKKIMELKSGDVIAIKDPTDVFLVHNNKRLFKGTAGQSDAKRVVQVDETL